MTITADDLKFFRAEQPHDLPTGGGRRTSIAVLGGAENNLFPDVAPAFRAAGGVQVRKFYPSVLSEDADVLMQAQVCLAQGPADPALDVVLFAFGDQQTTRAEAAKEIGKTPFAWNTSSSSFEEGDVFEVWPAHSTNTLPVKARVILSKNPDGSFSSAIIGAPDLPNATHANTIGLYNLSPTGTFASAATTTAVVASGDSAIPLNRVMARVVPNIAPYPITTFDGIETAQQTAYTMNLGNGTVTATAALGLSQTSGLVPIFRAGGAVRIAGGGVSEVGLVSRVDYRGALELSAPLVNSYPAGSTVSSLLNLGDLGASVARSFSQQTWTKTFSDALIGQPIGANYDRSHAITTTNLGAITERWAIVFTSPTAFRLIGERIGQVATGTIDATFAPVNPLTNRPYFTIPPGGWGSGWATGNVLRFNTAGAYAPVWAVRTVSPSAPGGLDGSTIEMRGGVDA